MPRNVTNSSDLNLLGKFPPEGTEFIYPLHNDRVNMWFLVRVLCSWVCPWILLRPHHRAKCWLSVPAFYLSSCFLPRDVQGRLRSNKLLNWTVSCKLVGNLISSNPNMSMNPIQPHSVLGGDIIRFLLALSYQWSCFVSPKSFQSHLAVKANTNIFLLPNVQLNFIVTCCSAIQWNET